MDNVKTKCVNGDIQAGDLVISTPNDDYSCLIGRVTRINLVGTPEHDAETQNETDDVHVCFVEHDYSNARIKEIEKAFSYLYGMKKSFEECPIDDAIMDPGCLIRITGINDNLLKSLLESGYDAASYCYGILSGLTKQNESVADVALPAYPDSTDIVPQMSGFIITRTLNGAAIKIELTEQEIHEVHCYQERRENIESVLDALYEMQSKGKVSACIADEIRSSDELLNKIVVACEKEREEYETDWREAVLKAIDEVIGVQKAD